jgi:uncharacterized protein (UPF0335 family)
MDKTIGISPSKAERVKALISSACSAAMSMAQKEIQSDIERLERENAQLAEKIRQLQAERAKPSIQD